MSRNLDGRDSLAGLDSWITRELDPGEYMGDPEPSAAEQRDDAIDSLQQAGMEPMSTAPKDREITIVLEANLVKVRAFWHDDIFSGGCWMNVDGVWGNDDPWPHWDSDELIGWLPAGQTDGAANG